MSISNSMHEALAKAINVAGGQAAFAVLVSTQERHVSQQLVSYWFRKGELPAELVLRVEILVAVMCITRMYFTQKSVDPGPLTTRLSRVDWNDERCLKHITSVVATG